MGLSPELAGDGGAGQDAAEWLSGDSFMYFKTFASLPFLLSTPGQLKHWELSTPTCRLEPNALLDLGGAWKGEPYRDIFTGPGWAWLELSQPVLQGSRLTSLSPSCTL